MALEAHARFHVRMRGDRHFHARGSCSRCTARGRVTCFVGRTLNGCCNLYTRFQFLGGGASAQAS
eukprot:2177858-Alexandrium_andersonii.AAC.1